MSAPSRPSRRRARHAGQALAALLATALLAAACTGPEALPGWATATARPADPVPTIAAPGATPTAPDAPTAAAPVPAGAAPRDLGEDLRVLTFAADAPVTFQTTAGDRSWALSVTGATPEDLVGVRRVVDPAGTLRYAADLGNELLLVDELHPRVLADEGAVGLYVAGGTGEALPAGTWEVAVVGNAGPPEVRVAIRSGDPGARQLLDVVVWATVELDDPAGVAAAWRAQMEGVLAPHDLGIGRLDVLDAGPAGAPYRTLGVDGLADEVHEACTAAAQQTGAPPRTAVVVLAERIGEGVLTAQGPGGVPGADAGMAVRRPDGDIDGFAVSTPGTPVLGPPSHACVAVSSRQDVRGRGLIALHEILHLTGLTWHTTERSGRDFDLLEDTPECPAAEFDRDRDLQVSQVECADRDAGNLMFWAAGGEELTADQAWRIRQHPLLQPAG